jgi:hypothetical protein
VKCPHCGHTDRIHSGPDAQSPQAVPGSCWHDSPDTPCPCPGWRYWIAADEWQMEMRMEQDRVDRAFGESAHTLWEVDG